MLVRFAVDGLDPPPFLTFRWPLAQAPLVVLLERLWEGCLLALAHLSLRLGVPVGLFVPRLLISSGLTSLWGPTRRVWG